MRRTVGEVLVRLLLLGAALTTLRFAELTWQDWQRHVGMTFDATDAWENWLGVMVLVALTGLLVGLASLPGPVKGYRWLMPLSITVPALLLIGHYVLLLENAYSGGVDLPWILGHHMFYMTSTSQFVLGVVAGIGIAAGFQPRRPTSTSDLPREENPTRTQ